MFTLWLNTQIKNMFESKNLYFVLSFLIAVTAVVMYWGGIEYLLVRWDAQPEYSHGYLIPFVSAYLLWENRFKLTSGPLTPNPWGIALCFFAFLLLIVGEVSSLFLLLHISLIIYLVGYTLMILGSRITVAAPSLILLLFAIPLPYFLEVVLTAKMQLISSAIGVAILRMFDISVYLSGNLIDFGYFKLQVVEACSGMRYLYPLASIGFIAAVFYKGAMWKKATVFLTTIPITIIMNSARIAVTGVLVDKYGSEAAEGFIHDFEGWVIFVICIVILILEILLIEFLTTKRSISEIFLAGSAQEPENREPVLNNTIVKRLNIYSVVLLSFTTASMILIYSIAGRQEIIDETVDLTEYPLVINEWTGRFESLEQNVIDGLGFTDYTLVNYRKRDGSRDVINLYVAYYESQRKGVSPHSPKVCMPGGGWEIAKLTREKLDGYPVNRAIIQKGLDSQLVYYWFVERGQLVANEYYKKWLLFRDAFTENRTDGSLVRLVIPITPGLGVEHADEQVKAFFTEANKQLLSILPKK